MTTLKNLFPRQALYKLFAVTAFPIHVWAIISWLREFPVVAKRTDVWDAFGVGAYTLVFAFFESVVIFLAILILFAIVYLVIRSLTRSDSKQMEGLQNENVLAQLSAGVLALSVVAIVDRMNIIYRLPFSDRVWNSGMMVLLVALVALSVIWIRKSDKMKRGVLGFVNAVVVLTSLYLFLDFAGLVVAIIRNLWTPA